jgi:hypothetical protein
MSQVGRKPKCSAITVKSSRCPRSVAPEAPKDKLCAQHWDIEYGHNTRADGQCFRCGYVFPFARQFYADRFKSKCPIPARVYYQKCRAQKPAPVVLPKLRNKIPGFVYLVRFHRFYKIGVSKVPEKRIKCFVNTKLPYEFECLHKIKTQDSFGLESELHRRFHTKRVNGEWFRLSSSDIAWVMSQ